MEIGPILYLVLTGMVIYYLGMNFTYGVRLYPRKRVGLRGKITKHPLHTVEAFLWPVAWTVLAFCGVLFIARVTLQQAGEFAFRTGKLVGNVEPQEDPQVKRRLNDIQEHSRH